MNMRGRDVGRFVDEAQRAVARALVNVPLVRVLVSQKEEPREGCAFLPALQYSLLGMARISEDALSRAMRINGLLAEWQRKVSRKEQVTS